MMAMIMGLRRQELLKLKLADRKRNEQHTETTGLPTVGRDINSME